MRLGAGRGSLERMPSDAPAIDPATGAIALDAPPFVIGRGLSRAAFLASEAAERARLLVQHGPHATYALDALLAARPFALALAFEGDSLVAVRLVDADPAFGTSFDDADEDARQAAHDAFLDAVLGAARTFACGSVESTRDPKTGDAVVVLRYGSD